MIILDSSETRSTSTMPSIEGAVLSPDLESLSGADVCISTLGAPCNNETLLRCHLKSRCILIQIKRLGDFLSSITDERINLAIAKMRTWTSSPWQRIIMSTGIFIPDLKSPSSETARRRCCPTYPVSLFPTEPTQPSGAGSPLGGRPCFPSPLRMRSSPS